MEGEGRGRRKRGGQEEGVKEDLKHKEGGSVVYLLECSPCQIPHT